MDLYISTKENLFFNPSYPNTYATLYDIVAVFFLYFKQREKLFALRPEAQGDTIPGGFWERKHAATVGKPLFVKEFNRSQNICYGLISFPGRNVQHCKANVRTSVYIGKLKGNQASSFSLKRNKSSFLGQGGVERKREGINGQLTLLECKG